MRARRWMHAPWLLAAAFAAAGAASCEGGAPEGVLSSCEDEVGLPPSISTDILFVIDNSISMKQEQDKVIAELAEFVDSLANGPVENDFQVGVVTTGVTLHAAGCDGTSPQTTEFPEESGRLQLGKQVDGSGSLVDAGDRKILAFDDPDLVDQFGMLVRQEIQGSGQEMGLEAMRLALSKPLTDTAVDADPSGNAGFLRDGSRLLVVIVSDEDDCSTSDPKAVTVMPARCGTDACTSDSDCTGGGEYCLAVDAADPSQGRSCQTNDCETPAARDALDPVEDYVHFLETLEDGRGRTRDVYLAVIGPVDDSGNPDRCSAGNDEAYGVGERYADAVGQMGERGLIASICSDQYGTALKEIAELVSAPQRLELPTDPEDANLLRITIRRGSQEIACRQGHGFEFSPATGDAPASVLMVDECRLHNADELDVSFVCAG